MLNSLREGKQGFGLQSGNISEFNLSYTSSRVDIRSPPQNRIAVHLITEVHGFGEVTQTARLTSPKETSMSIRLSYDARVVRAPYGQLTEGGILPLPKSETRLFFCGDVVYLVNRHLKACLESEWFIDDKAQDFHALTPQNVLMRNLNLSPNSWQIFFLQMVRQYRENLFDEDSMAPCENLVKSLWEGHLHFLFFVAERPLKYWHRSYLVNGKPKDGPKFQLDQQWYPLLELYQYHAQYPDSELVKDILDQRVHVDILNILVKRKHKTTGFISTDETPADDPVEAGYHLSSHILLCNLSSAIL
ncbi:hypothetical protein DL768_010729 [Monosporascus sp. mg162]|nr:hypothetical protein DL768_010729 [Monosporascus sp. mg162]